MPYSSWGTKKASGIHNSRHIGFFCKRFVNTFFRSSSYNSYTIFSRIGRYHCQTNPHSNHHWNFDFPNRLSGSNATKQEVVYISANLWDIKTSWYVPRKTLQHVTMCKGNFISPKMIDIKPIEFITNAKIMLYTSDGSKSDILIHSQVHKSERKLNVRWKVDFLWIF